MCALTRADAACAQEHSLKCYNLIRISSFCLGVSAFRGVPLNDSSAVGSSPFASSGNVLLRSCVVGTPCPHSVQVSVPERLLEHPLEIAKTKKNIFASAWVNQNRLCPHSDASIPSLRGRAFDSIYLIVVMLFIVHSVRSASVLRSHSEVKALGEVFEVGNRIW